MSNVQKPVSFSLSQFNRALAVITASADDKGSATAEWLASQLKRAALSWLLDGSDALSQCLAKIEASGKASTAVKLRKVLRGIDFQFNDGTPEKPVIYGNVAGFAHVKADGFISGQSQRCTDHARRVESANAFGQLVLITGNVIFAKPIREGEVDPLAPFGNFKLSTIATRLASATDEQLASAVKRTSELLIVLQEYQAAIANKAAEAAKAAEADPVSVAKAAKAAEAAEADPTAAAEAAKAAKAAEAAEAAKVAEAAKAAEAAEALTTRARQPAKRERAA